MENQSLYDPSRKTVGAIYRDAQINNSEKFVTNGDLTNELMSSLVDDLNETIQSRPFGDESFYIIIHESKDMQMPRLLRRRMIKMKKRPYPEDDTIVFHVDPKTNIVKFSWCLPHWSEMDNMLSNENLFDQELIAQIKAWKRVDLTYFGFHKDEMGNWKANPKNKDQEMKNKISTSSNVVQKILF